MTNMILYEIKSKENYDLFMLVDRLKATVNDDSQGIILHEYDEKFLKATYWKKKKRRESRYNIDKSEFEFVEEEIVNVADFDIQMTEKKLLIFGSKDMAQRIITIISVASKNAFIISEYVIDIGRLIQKICSAEQIELLKMKLNDIAIEKSVLVSCNVKLAVQDEPIKLVLKYINNIVVISFKLKQIPVVVTVYKAGKISIGKISEEEHDELIRTIMQIVD